MEVIVVQRNLQMDGITTAKFVNVLKCQKQLKYLLNQLRLHLIVLINGLVTIIVMIKITILNVKWMEVIVVKKMLKRDGIITAMIAYVLKFQKLLKLHLNVLNNGLGTTSVMIKITILNVKWMEVIVVKRSLLLDGISIAVIASVLKCQKQLKLLLKQQRLHQSALINGLVIPFVTIKTIILNAAMMVVIVVEMMSTPLTALNVHVLNDFKLLILRTIFRTY